MLRTKASISIAPWHRAMEYEYATWTRVDESAVNLVRQERLALRRLLRLRRTRSVVQHSLREGRAHRPPARSAVLAMWDQFVSHAVHRVVEHDATSAAWAEHATRDA